MWRGRILATLARLQKGIPEELLAIVTQAMARDPARRYPSAKDLAEDLRRFLTGQLVGAHHYSRLDLLKRFVRRNRRALAVAGTKAGVFVSTNWSHASRSHSSA